MGDPVRRSDRKSDVGERQGLPWDIVWLERISDLMLVERMYVVTSTGLRKPIVRSTGPAERTNVLWVVVN